MSDTETTTASTTDETAGPRTTRIDGSADDYLFEAELYDLLWADLNTLDLPFILAKTEEFGGPLLELACGTGRVLLPCAERVERAVGVDRSPSMLAQARATADAAGVPEDKVRLVEGDLRDFDLGERFPLIIAGGQPLFHMPTDEDWARTLDSVRRHLAPGGRFVAGVPVFQQEDFDKYDQRYLFVDEVRHPSTGQRVAIWDYSAFDFDVQSITRRRVTELLDEQGLVVQRRHDLRTNYYRFPDQIRGLFEKAGLRIEREYGGYDESPFDADSEYYIWVATPAD
ncbi:methyltransferase domain-containing protein [Streptomyces sp. NBC_00637]|uniref:class I SAM-dependent methyltransferase n=1 Tax=Streptomyces sp. NBC_00637 TaxID=2903667 RepID=UPI003253E262